LSDWLGRASAEGRAALEALRSSSIEANDLAGALRRVAEDCIAGQGTKVTVEALGMDRELHPIARDEVYRIGYEAIRNACVHSNATELQVEIAYGRKFRLEIRDNGSGIEPGVLRHGRPGHYGLAGMRERAAGTGGQLNISSSPLGTVVSLVIPGQAIYKNSSSFRSWLLGHLRRRWR
jgi:signal transduction histidine kinase